MKDANLNDSDNPLAATALEHGFIPESDGLAAVDLDRRIMSSLPHIAYMVSKPRQTLTREKLCFLDTVDRMPPLDLIGFGIGNKVSKACEYRRQCGQEDVLNGLCAYTQDKRCKCVSLFHSDVQGSIEETLEETSGCRRPVQECHLGPVSQ